MSGACSGGGGNSGNGGGGGVGGAGGSGGGGTVITIEKVEPHPVLETLSGIQYCINSNPPWGQFSLSFSLDFSYSLFLYFSF